MKIFNCDICKNKHNYLTHCTFFSQEPDVDICYGFSPPKENITNKNQNINQIIKQKAISLINDFQDIGFTFDDWFNTIKNSIYNSKIKNKDIVNFIKTFGDNGFVFACDSCGNIVELEEDIHFRCLNCGNQSLIFISILN